MDKQKLIKALEDLKQNSQKRNFNQTYELIVNVQGLDFKKTENQVDFFMNIPHKIKQKKICALVGPELYEDAKKICDRAISQEDFEKYKDKKVSKKLAREFDFFLAQANIMSGIASTFGKVLGPKGKMPNPKSGCIVPPKGNLKVIYEKLQTTIRVSAKTPVMHCPIGKEDFPTEKVADNLLAVYDSLVHHLPNEKNNIKGVYVKLTMSKPVKLDLA